MPHGVIFAPRLEAIDPTTVLPVYEFVSDIDAALKELGRVQKPRGQHVIIDTDFDSMALHSEDSALTDRF